MAVEHILYTESLKQGTDKINAAIDQSNEALGKAEQSLNESESATSIANQALASAESTQTQLNTIVINGDSSVESAQARVDMSGFEYDTLKERLDTEYGKTVKKEDVYINVKDYGAVGDGVTDDTFVLQSMFDEIPNNSIVVFPAGHTFIVSNITLNKYVTIFGYKATIKTNSATGHIIDCVSWNINIFGISIDSNIVRTSGCGIFHGYSNGAGFIAKDINFKNQYDCINIGGVLDKLSYINMRDYANNGVVVESGTDQTIEFVVSDNTTQPAGSGILITRTGACFISNCDIIRSNIDLNINVPSSSAGVYAIYCTNCYFDTANSGLIIQGTGAVQRIKFINCWFSSHSGIGIHLNNASANGIDFVNCDIYNNSSDGIRASFCADWSISNSRIAGNTGSAISVSQLSLKFRINGNVLSPTSGFGANSYAIYINSGTYTRYEVTNNVVNNNTINSIIDGGSSIEGKIIKDNIGYNPRGNVTAPAIPSSGISYLNPYGCNARVIISGGTVTNISLHGATTGLTTGMFILSPNENISLTYSVAPTWKWILM